MYTLTLENFSFPNLEATNNKITTIVKDTIHSNPDVLQYIHNNTSFPDTEAAICTIESICVLSLNLAHFKTKKETVWNIYF